jgi:hypothetical protein
MIGSCFSAVIPDGSRKRADPGPKSPGITVIKAAAAGGVDDVGDFLFSLRSY